MWVTFSKLNLAAISSHKHHDSQMAYSPTKHILSHLC